MVKQKISPALSFRLSDFWMRLHTFIPMEIPILLARNPNGSLKPIQNPFDKKKAKKITEKDLDKKLNELTMGTPGADDEDSVHGPTERFERVYDLDNDGPGAFFTKMLDRKSVV